MQTQLIGFLVLYLAHLTADFPLQTAWIAENKSSRLSALIAHISTHYLLSIGLLGVFSRQLLTSKTTYFALGVLVISHAGLDQAKSWITKKKFLPNNGLVFVIDQLLHLLMVAVAAIYLSKIQIGSIWSFISVSELTKIHILEIATIYVAIVFASGYFIRYLTRSLSQDVRPTGGETTEQLRNAGLYIGWLERFLVLTAILVQSPTMVGLILTGKSIARFPELGNPRFAEYFLIGTFLSVLFAVIGGLCLNYLVWGSVSLK